MNGQSEIVAVSISPEAVDPEDVEMLEDMIMAAVTDAVEKSKNLAAEKMGHLGVPGGLGGLM